MHPGIMISFDGKVFAPSSGWAQLKRRGIRWQLHRILE